MKAFEAGELYFNVQSAANPGGDAANAKARASQQEAKGNLPPSAKKPIDAKADRILGKDSH